MRDPFFKMMKRSLTTFMNAMTAIDHTFYPVSTTNVVDMKNLRDVYLDAVLAPHLRKLDFLQEGWRLEREHTQDADSPLVFKGVVYNEMKGNMVSGACISMLTSAHQGDAFYVFYIGFLRAMFSGSIYGNNSGGDPQYITDLTHDELVSFHRTHYHPSNCKIITYGNMDVQDHLAALGERFEKYTYSPVEKVDREVTPWNETRRVTCFGPHDQYAEPDRQHKISVSFLLQSESKTVYDRFVFNFLSSLLTNGHSAPLYKALIAAGWGSEFTPNSRFDDVGQSAVFSVGVQGARAEDLPSIEKAIYNELESVAHNGFPRGRIDALLHQIEIGQKHRTSSFGMRLSQQIVGPWINGVSPLESFKYEEILRRFQHDIAQPTFFQDLIKSSLLENKSRLVFVMQPSDSFQEDQNAEEQARLERVRASLTKADIEGIDKVSRELAHSQDTLQDSSVLPTLTVDDISREKAYPELETHMTEHNVPVNWLLKESAGLTYLRSVCNVDSLPEALVPYLPLYCTSLRNLGTTFENIEQLEEEIKLKTGSLAFRTSMTIDPSDIDKYHLTVAVSSFALDRNAHDMTRLLAKLVFHTNFDNHDKLKEIIRMEAGSLSSSIADSAHSYATCAANSALTSSGKEADSLDGLPQVKLMNELSRMEDMAPVSAKLKEISQHVFRRESTRFLVTCSPDSVKESGKAVGELIRELPESQAPPASRGLLVGSGSSLSLPQKNYFKMPFGVGYAALSLRGVPYTHPDGAALTILAHVLETHLHREIREKGGAYGGSLSYSALLGLANFYTYRDPNEMRSLEVMRNAWQRGFDNLERDALQEAKLSVFQSLDSPLSVSEEGVGQFITGLSPAMQQRRREQLLDVDMDSLRRVADHYMGQALQAGKYSAAVLGPLKETLGEDWHVSSSSF